MQTIITVLHRGSAMVIFLLVFGISKGHAQFQPSIPPNQLVLPSTSYTIPFKWQGDSAGAQWEPHAALLVPVKLPSCPKQFYMQFDLGSPYSMFYSGALAKVQSKYPKAFPLADTSKVLKNCTFMVGDMPVQAKEIVVKQFGSPQKDVDEKDIVVIGTIGADFIDGRMILIDYPHQSIINGTEMPSTLKVTYPLSDFMYAGRSILLPAVIAGNNTVLFFDTGSSAFELITDKKTVDAVATPGAVPVQYAVKSWNRVLTAYTIAASGNITMASQTIPLHNVTYIEGASKAQIDMMMKMGIGGLTGNKLFINHKLLLDTRNKKFGIFMD